MRKFFYLNISLQSFIFNLNIPRQCIDINWKLSSKYAIQLMIFSSIWRTILKFLFQNRKHAFFTVHRTVPSWCIKMYKIFAIPWISTALCPLHTLVSSPDSADHSLMCGCCWAMDVHPRTRWATWQGRPAIRWCGVGSGPWVGHAWDRASVLFLKMSRGLSYQFTEISVNCE